jgi:branched-chain amino acid transport system ATP-binding protein
MLELREIQTGYGETQIIHGLDLSVAPGTVHALLGRNGVGKSTTMKAIMGLLPITAGRVVFDGRDITDAPAHVVAKTGLAYVPETRDMFGALTLRENLELAGRLGTAHGGAWSIARVLDFFPSLKGRLDNGGTQLSGGEQQMAAIGRALMMAPRTLLLDEPTEGLAPIIVRQIAEKLAELKAEGMTMLLVEQNLAFALRLADEITLIGRGQAVWHGTSEALAEDEAVQGRWLGV